MIIDKEPTPLQKWTFSLYIIWVGAVTTSLAPVAPPSWAEGALFPVWWLIFMVCAVIASFVPSGIAVVVGNRLFGKSGVVVFGFCTLWILDSCLREDFPQLPRTPGFALAMVYTYISLNNLGKIRP